VTGDAPVRTYGGWRRSRSMGLLGLGPAATLALLGSFAVLILVAAVSLRALMYVVPPVVLGWSAGVVRARGTPLALVVLQRLRWRRGTRAGYTSYRAEVVRRHTGVLTLPGALAATELLSAEDGCGGRYGLVRDRHTGYLTATLRVAPVSTWLADAEDADRWVANWAAWLASLGYLPALRWVTVTVDTAPDPGSTLTGQVAAAIDPSAPRAAVEIMDQLVAAAPAAAADVNTWVSLTFDPRAFPAQPRDIAAAVIEAGQALAGEPAPSRLPGIRSSRGDDRVAGQRRQRRQSLRQHPLPLSLTHRDITIARHSLPRHQRCQENLATIYPTRPAGESARPAAARDHSRIQSATASRR